MGLAKRVTPSWLCQHHLLLVELEEVGREFLWKIVRLYFNTNNRDFKGTSHQTYKHSFLEFGIVKTGVWYPLRKVNKCCGYGHTSISGHRVRRAAMGQTPFPVMVGKSECLLELRCSPCERETGVTSEGILPNKLSDYLKGWCDPNRRVGAQKPSKGAVLIDIWLC